MKNIFSWLYFFVVSAALIFLVKELNQRWEFFAPEPRYPVTLFHQTELPVFEATASAGAVTDSDILLDSLSAQAVFVVEMTHPTVLLEKNPQLPLPPASTAKLLTVLTALQHFDLNNSVLVSTAAAREHTGSRFFPLEEVAVKDLAAAAIIQSDNSAAWALADAYQGGIPAFVEQMNAEAQALHLWNSRFENPVGYDHPEMVATAHDLAVLASRAFQEPPIARWMGLSHSVIADDKGRPRHFLFTTNELLGKDPDVIAGKTGTTPQAKEVLITIANIHGYRYCLVIMGSSDRYGDTRALLNWIRENIIWQKKEFPLQIQPKTR